MAKVNKTSSVSLYERTLNSGKIKLYLKVYAAGKRVEEGTGVTILPNDTKKIIKEKRAAAEDYRRKRERELQSFMLGLSSPEEKIDDSFFSLYKEFCETKSGSTKVAYESAAKHMHAYEPDENITLRFITRDWVKGFKKYLLNDAINHDVRKKNRKKLSQNSASAMFAKLVSFLNSLVKDNVIQVSPANKIGGIPLEETTRSFLTPEEVNVLYNTPCDREDVKRAFLFSCFTGFRISDCRQLRWSHIMKADGKTMITISTKKTKSVVYTEISSQAEEFLGEPSDGLVFEGVKHSKIVNSAIKKWVESAGLKTHITFHCARHTFATMLLTYGADLYTVSKLLGHRKITTTQIYAKIVDDKKTKALNSLSAVLLNDVK